LVCVRAWWREPPPIYFAANNRVRFGTLHIRRAVRRVATATDSPKVQRREDQLTYFYMKPMRYTSAEQAAALQMPSIPTRRRFIAARINLPLYK
jgi:hypothetical protein